jgi:hypothetical protein
MAFLIYLMSVADGVKILFTFTSVIFLASFAILLIAQEMPETKEETLTKIPQLLKKVFISSVVFLILSIFTPNSKTIAMIYVLPKIEQNVDFNELQNEAAEIYTLCKEVLRNKVQEKR